MKKLFTITLLITFQQLAFSQSDGISYVSHKRDTLILPDNNLGKLISKTWDTHPTAEKKPFIQFATESKIKELNQRLYNTRQRKTIRASIANN